MNESININPDVNIKEEEYLRLLGYTQDYKLEGRPRELADWARDWYNKNGKPWVYSIPSTSINLANQKLLIDGIELSSKKLLKQFVETDTNRVILAAVSAGEECENKARKLWAEGKPDEYFFLEVYGSAVVEHLITQTGFKFCEWGEQNNYAVLPNYSPGYAGWNIEDQHNLFQLINRKNGNLKDRISVLETGMLKPKKSLLAVFGLTKELEKVKNIQGLIPCETCSLRSCRYRRAPFKHPRKLIEDVRNLQPSENIEQKIKSPLTSNVKYSVNPKALEKWSKEKLRLNFCEDNSVEAKFCYQGSTCSNMGHSLMFEYHIKLGSPEENYKINFLECKPVDDGYKFMCEYIKEPNQFMKIMNKEKPYLGKSFYEVIDWKRQFSPEGCYCKSESREHKWGLAFEVLHYALTEYENKKSNISINEKIIS